jgi:hypothetical protein
MSTRALGNMQLFNINRPTTTSLPFMINGAVFLLIILYPDIINGGTIY